MCCVVCVLAEKIERESVSNERGENAFNSEKNEISIKYYIANNNMMME